MFLKKWAFVTIWMILFQFLLLRKKLWIFCSRLFTAVPRSQVFPPWPPWLGGRLLSLGVWWGARGGELWWTGEGSSGGPGAGPGSLGELAGNDGELAGVCRACPSHENLHQLPPPHLTAPRTCAAWYPRGQSILNYIFFAYKTFYWFQNVFYLFVFFLP